jgi:hypothetical protein
MQLIPTATDANFILDKIRPETASTLSHLVVCFNFYYFFCFEMAAMRGRVGVWVRGGGGEGGTRYKNLQWHIIWKFFLEEF